VRNVLLIVGGFLLVIGGIAGGALFYFYDKATAIDRSTPQVSTRQFLDAALVQKDPSRVGLFVCGAWSAEEAIEAMGVPAEGVVVTWGDSVANVTGDTATVTVRVVYRVSVGGVIQQDPQMWTLDLVQEDGWRVCDLTKEPSLNP
jgi:hypothetical protein